MIVLDTNVVSEVLRDHADPEVLQWLESVSDQDVALTTVTLAELLAGVALMPTGRRRLLISEAVRRVVEPYRAAGRILPFDEGAASHYASIVSARRAAGRPISTADAQIAAICRAHDAVCATRNTRDFEGVDVNLFDPWVES